jgi:hypothetical protein
MDLDIPKVHVPILVKIKHDQRAPQRRIQEREPQTEEGTHDRDHHHTIAAAIDGEVENEE